MKSWMLKRVSPIIEGGSLVIDNLGQIPRPAKRLLRFVNVETGEMSEVEDLLLQKQRRNRKFIRFKNTYMRLFENRSVSVLIIVADISRYPSPSKFTNDFFKKLNRKGIKVFGYIGLRDIGDVRFKRHYHFIIVTTRLVSGKFVELFQRKKSKFFDVELADSLGAKVNYLIKKEVYSPPKCRSYFTSELFSIPTN